MPTRSPAWRRTWPIMRTVVVFPFVPVTAMTGIRDGAPGGYRLSMIAPATSRGVPSAGDWCIRSPGQALTSMTVPPWSMPRRGGAMSGSRTSTPPPPAAPPAVPVLRGRLGIGRGCLGRGGDADDHADAVAAVARLDDHGPAELLEACDGLPGAPGHDSLGYRDAGVGQQPLGQHLVGGDVHPDHRGLLGERRVHQPAVAAVTEPEQAQVADPPDRDSPAA